MVLGPTTSDVTLRRLENSSTFVHLFINLNCFSPSFQADEEVGVVVVDSGEGRDLVAAEVGEDSAGVAEGEVGDSGEEGVEVGVGVATIKNFRFFIC